MERKILSMSEMKCLIDHYFNQLLIPADEHHLYTFDLIGQNGEGCTVVKVSKWLNGRNPNINIWTVGKDNLGFEDRIVMSKQDAFDYSAVLREVFEQSQIRLLPGDVEDLRVGNDHLLVVISPQSLRYSDTLKIKLV